MNVEDARQMIEKVVGIDVAKASFDVAVPLAPRGKYRTKGKLANHAAGFAALGAWLDRYAPGAAVCMEATGVYHEALAGFLVARGVTVYVANPAQVAAFAKSELSRIKTDHTDAKLIARFAMAHLEVGTTLRPWVPPTPAQRELRAMVHRLDDLEGMRQMEHNRLDVCDSSVRGSIVDVIALLDAQIKALKKAIHHHIDSDKGLKHDAGLLDSIPGVGELTAAFLLGCAGDLRRFGDPRKLEAFAGMNPAVRQSGRWAGHPRLSKLGPALLRAKLYMPAVTASRYNTYVHALYCRLLARGKPHLVALAAAMRKLLDIAWGVIHSGKPFNPLIGLA